MIGAGDAEILRRFNQQKLQVAEPQPFRTLMNLGLLQFNPQVYNPGSNPTDHGRYQLTGLGWVAVIGAGWLLLRRSSPSSSAAEE